MKYVLYFTLALPEHVCSVQWGWFCSSLILCLPVKLLRYCQSDFEMVPFTRIITGITLLLLLILLLIIQGFGGET